MSKTSAEKIRKRRKKKENREKENEKDPIKKTKNESKC